jgi:hypothetical protein
MKLTALLLAVFLLFAGTNLYSQNFEVPTNYQLKAAADYTQYEKDVIAAAKWLKDTPLNEQSDKRREVAAFVISWISGSPTVNVEINPIIMDFNKKNEGMLLMYMAFSARYVLENNYSKDMRAKHKAALKDMISVYKLNQGIKKDKKMEKLIKSDEGGTLDDWLSENLKVN